MSKRIFTDLDEADADFIAQEYQDHGWTVIKDEQSNGLWRVEVTK